MDPIVAPPAARDAVPGVENPIHPALCAVFAALDRAAARWCLLRGDVTLADPEGDVDILVGREDLDRARPLLADLAFAEVPGRGYGTHHFFLGYHRPSGRWIRLDLITELQFGAGRALGPEIEAALLDRRQPQGPISRLDGEDAFWVQLLHLLLNKGAVAGRGAVQLSQLAEEVPDPSRNTSPLDLLVDALCPAGWSADRILTSVRSGRYDLLQALTPALEARWRRWDALGGLRRRARSRCRRGRDRLLRLWHHPGLIVELRAPLDDLPAVIRSVADSFFFPVRCVPRCRTSLLVRYHRVRGRLVLLHSHRTGVCGCGVAGTARSFAELTLEGPAPMNPAGSADADCMRRELTASLWMAYVRRWGGRRPTG